MSLEELFRTYRAPAEALRAVDGRFVNFLGVSTATSILPQGPALSGKVYDELPIPGDSVFAGAAEYQALLTAIDACKAQPSLTVAEFGAGWGPWVSAAGVVGKRLGIKDIRLIAVEADSEKYKLMQAHLAYNGLAGQDGVSIATYEGAVWHTDTTLNFPKNIVAVDFGGRVSETSHSTDYRGMAYETTEIRAYALESLLKGEQTIDYMHVDVQGAEYEILSRAGDLMNEKVKYLFIGTHSRLIDGQLLELLHKWGWDIRFANPCQFVFNRSIPTIEGMTVADGEIFAVNTRLAG